MRMKIGSTGGGRRVAFGFGDRGVNSDEPYLAPEKKWRRWLCWVGGGEGEKSRTSEIRGLWWIHGSEEKIVFGGPRALDRIFDEFSMRRIGLNLKKAGVEAPIITGSGISCVRIGRVEVQKRLVPGTHTPGSTRWSGQERRRAGKESGELADRLVGGHRAGWASTKDRCLSPRTATKRLAKRS
ncbi:uncharacterized protein [Prorops nasuta]|uniref:uncharacterized protein n=1 Tax=Prorops nasuta TaxID=863751 RepID=UPI0034CD0633